jgi:hypothetical protein
MLVEQGIELQRESFLWHDYEFGNYNNDDDYVKDDKYLPGDLFS